MVSKLEASYILNSLLASPPIRADGRGTRDRRPLILSVGVVPLANGSSRVVIGGGNDHKTEVIVGVKMEVDDEGGLVCAVQCSPSAYPSLSTSALDDLSADLTSLLQSTLSHPSFCPTNLSIPGGCVWVACIDVLVLQDAGNLYEAIWAAVRCALCDTRVPRTREIGEAVQVGGRESTSTFDALKGAKWKHKAQGARANFELADFGDEGEPLEGREAWPVGITLNVVPPMYYLDATLIEEAATPLKLVLAFSFEENAGGSTHLRAIRTLGGTGEMSLSLEAISELIKEGEKHARKLHGLIEKEMRGTTC